MKVVKVVKESEDGEGDRGIPHVHLSFNVPSWSETVSDGMSEVISTFHLIYVNSPGR